MKVYELVALLTDGTIDLNRLVVIAGDEEGNSFYRLLEVENGGRWNHGDVEDEDAGGGLPCIVLWP